MRACCKWDKWQNSMKYHVHTIHPTGIVCLARVTHLHCVRLTKTIATSATSLWNLTMKRFDLCSNVKVLWFRSFWGTYNVLAKSILVFAAPRFATNGNMSREGWSSMILHPWSHSVPTCKSSIILMAVVRFPWHRVSHNILKPILIIYDIHQYR